MTWFKYALVLLLIKVYQFSTRVVHTKVKYKICVDKFKIHLTS